MTHLYRYIPIWRRIENGAVLYRVFEVIGLGYSVQSKDFFYADALKDCTPSMEAQFLELLIEQAPDERCGTSATIEAAVLEFEQQFFAPAEFWPVNSSRSRPNSQHQENRNQPP